MVKQIVIVDDDGGVIHTVKYGLEHADSDMKVVGIESGSQFFEFLEKHPLPDLVILDIMMPEMNGWEIHRRLKQHQVWKHIPLLFLTATADNTSKFVGKMYGEGFLEKPFTLPDLKKKIDEIFKA